MLEEGKLINSSPQQVHDKLSSTTFTLNNGQIITQTEGKKKQIWTIPLNQQEHRSTSHRYLHFSTPKTTHLSVNPWGNVLVSNSQRFQQVELSETFTTGSVWWEFFIPHTTLSLTVGVKDKKNNQFFNFDFSSKDSLRLIFKLNLSDRTFKTWINGIQSQSKPAISLPENASWIPFVRVRQSGTTLSLNPFIQDPEGQHSKFNIFTELQDAKQLRSQGQKIEDLSLNFKKDSSIKQIQLHQNHILLVSPQSIRVVPRNSQSYRFELDKWIQVQQSEQRIYFVAIIPQNQYNLFKFAAKTWNKNLLGGLISFSGSIWVKKTKDQWLEWSKSICKYLQNQVTLNKTQLIYQIYEVTLSLISRVFSAMNIPENATRWNKINKDLIKSMDRHTLKPINFYEAFISQNLSIMNSPAIAFAQKIMGVNSYQSYLSVRLVDNKISIFSTRGASFKLGDFIISKAIKKDSQLTESAKQADQIRGALGQPTIYKILKNCLKYADKVKPPEKLVKQLANRKQKKIEKSKKKDPKEEQNKVAVNKELEGTLIQMGFDPRIIRKALIQCNNASLEAAMDLVLGGTIVIEQEKPPVPTKQWTCQTCTLVNARTVTNCAVCDTPMPANIEQVQKSEEKEKIESLVEELEEEVKSDKIEQQLEQVFTFATGIALAPVIVAGVFKSSVRFRLYALNPRFFASCYAKGDLFADLITNNFYERAGQIPAESIEKVISYLSPEERRQKSVSWMALEDVDLPNKTVKEIKFHTFGIEKGVLRFSATMVDEGTSKNVFFSFDTSKIYLEKQRSLVVSPQLKEKFEVQIHKQNNISSKTQMQKFCFERSNIKASQFEIILTPNNRLKSETNEINITNEDKRTTASLLPLYVLHTPQQTSNYPDVKFTTPWSRGYEKKRLWKNGIVLSNLKERIMQIECLSLEIANKDQKVQGYFYFANDYTLQPTKMYKFAFEGGKKRQQFNLENIHSGYIVVILEPHQEDKLIQLSKIQVYGSIMSDSFIPNPNQIPIKLKKDPVIDVIISNNNQIKSLVPHMIQFFSINHTHDLTIQKHEDIEDKGDLKIVAYIDNTANDYAELKNIEINGYSVLKINAIQRQNNIKKSNAEIDQEFSTKIQEYLTSRDKKILHRLISSDFNDKKNEANLTQLKSYIQYLVSMPYRNQCKNDARTFLRHFLPSICKEKENIKLSSLIEQGLRSKDLTANGLELLIWLGSETESFTSVQLNSLFTEVVNKLESKIKNNSHQYNIFNQKSIFSPFVYFIGRKEEGDINQDKISSRIILKKLRYSRLLTIDLLSCHKLRQLELKFDKSETKNKVIVNVSWYDKKGQLHGYLNFGYDYSVWNNLCFGNKPSNRILSIPLQKYNIEARYLQIQIDFTLHPFTACKHEINNLTDNEIIPTFYGAHIEQIQSLPNLQFDVGVKNLKFIKKVGLLTKFIVTSSQQKFMYLEYQLDQNQQSLEKLTDTLQLKNNHQKWLSVMMRNASQDNINYHYTMYAVLAQELLKTREIDAPTQPVLQGLMIIENKQVGPILTLNEKLLKLMYQKHSEIFLQVLKHSNYSKCLVQIFSKNNPFFDEKNIKKVIDQLKSKNINIAKNSLYLFSEVCNLQNNLHQQMYRKIHEIFLSQNLFDDCIVLYERNGWMKDLPIKLIDKVIESNQNQAILQRICKSAKKTEDLVSLIENEIIKQGPSQIILNMLEQLAQRTASSPIDGNQIYISALKERQQQFDEQIPSNYVQRLLKSSPSFNLNTKTFSLLMLRIFGLRQKNMLWTQLKTLPIMKNKDISIVILNYCLQVIRSWVNTSRRKRINNQDQLKFVCQLLSFIDNYQPQNNNEVFEIFSKLLFEQVNWDGKQGCRYLNKRQTISLTIAYHLAKICPENQSSKSIDNIIKWNILNQCNTINQQNSTTAVGQFSFIQKTAWIILLNILRKSEESARNINDILLDYLNCSNILNRSNRYLGVNLRSKVYNFILCLLKETKNNQDLEVVCRSIFEKHGFFNKILNILSTLNNIQNQDNQIIKQQQIANSLTLVGQQQPKDWLTYRSGAKNHVFELKYEGKGYHSLFFERQHAYWPSVIVVGFQTNSGSGGTILAPNEILVQMGDNKDKLSLVGHLNQIPFETFSGYSVKVYALNLHRISTKYNPKTNLRSHKYLKLTFVSPYHGLVVDGAEEKNGLSASKYISYINFLSILAYAQNGPEVIPDDIVNLVGTLEQLADARHIKLMTDLLSDGSNVKLFQQCLKGVSYLLSSERYNKIAHKFLLRTCQVNALLGESMLKQYFESTNPVLSAKMVGQIVLTNQEHSINRAKRYYNFLAQKLTREVKDSEILPFIDNFSQIISTLHRNSKLTNSSKTDVCQLLEKNIQLILSKASESLSYRKLARTILVVETPLTFELQADGKNKQHLWEQLFMSIKATDRQLLASLINASPACIQWFLQKDYLNFTFKTIFESLQKTDQPMKSLVDRLNFLTLLCRNFIIKENVTKAQLDLQIFELLVNGNEKGLLAKPDSSQLRECLVNFIAVASLGSPNERIIGALLKDSLNTTILEGSSKFVGQVFLPLLNSYSKTVVCLVPFSAEQNKIMADLSSLQHFQANKKVQIHQNEKFKLGSIILNDNQKESLLGKIKQSTGHKWGIFKLISSHGQLSSNKSLLNLKSILDKQKQILILIEAGKKKIGLFYCAKDILKIENTMTGNKRSFLFECNDKETKILAKGNPNQNMASFVKLQDEQYESLQIFYNNKSAAQIRYGALIDSTLSASAINNSNEGNLNINSVQYWYFDSQSSESYENVWANENVFTKRLLSQLSDCTFFRKQFKSSNSLELLRQEPLFEFPSSITIKQLFSAIEVLGRKTKSDSTFEIRLPNGGHVNHASTLGQLAKGANGQMILDILVDLQGVISSLDLNSNQQKTQFLPSKGILKYFEENQGVKSMIIAIKKSINDWSNATRKEKWLQYINQVQKFSGFPHFFGVYLRQRQTFNLLLEILSGLPDKQADTKWDEKQVQASQRLLKIVSDILYMENSQQFRAHAIKHDFLVIILGRLKILSGAFARHYQEIIEEQQQTIMSSPDKKGGDDDGTKKIKKKKGVGYTAQTNSNTKWMKEDNMASRKKQFESIEPILMLIEGFLGGANWKAPHQLLKQIQCSCLLPYIEECLRAGTLLEMSKHPQKYRSVLKVIRAISKQENLVPTLIPLSKHYEPAQIESIQSLLKSLNNTSKIFLSCLGQNLSQQDKISQQLADDLISTYNIVDEVVVQYAADEEDVGQIQHALSLPLDKKYRLLMKDLRFDYIDMKQSPTKIKHHYASNFNANYKPNQTKMIRLAQELADISTALPHEHTNAVYVRCDKDRVDFMQALIMGSNGTPYGHGAFLFDIYFDDNYPNGPPKVNLTTTGHGKIRFNPNLYACGKVCLSLLGTWRGSASQNWDAKVSTLLQVLLSIQAIIMSEQVYFNEPGFEGEQGTQEGEKKNEAYSNIVRFGNIKFAMLENIKNPPKGFESVIRRHFYLKKDQIMEECRKWLKYAEKRSANYVGLVNDHNSSWASQYKKSKTQYKQNLEKVVKELEEELNKLPAPSASDLAHKQNNKRIKKKKETTNMKDLEKMQHQEIDVSYSNKMSEDRELDINDEKVRDRWSRYIGAMGIDAVSRQAKADILVFGLGPFALEVVKNLVLSGCKRLTIVEDGDVDLFDLAGGFFYTQQDIGKKKVNSVIHKIRELNCYVKVDTISRESLTADLLAKYTIVLATELDFSEQIKYATICREKGIKFVSADCFGAACRITNDYGKFEVLDKNGEQPVEVMIKDIECSERGLVTLLDGAKHSYEDGQAIVINQIEGMKLKEDNTKSINGAIRKVKVINFKSFEIGDTRMFEPYIRNGTAKNIKTPVIVEFPPLEKAFDPKKPVDMDQELEYFDFAKQPKSELLRLCFITLDQFRTTEKRFPAPWNKADSELFKTYFMKNTSEQLTASDYKFANQFAFSCRGNLPPLCAFFGGLVSQQIIKGITQKYKPISPSFYLNFMEVLPNKEQDKQWSVEELAQIYQKGSSRDEGLCAVVGRKLVEMASDSRIFMVGAGAIGCELLKNFAMIGLGTGESGKIVVTDPDHIENSNLNRQFLFREKHISKPKSLTAAASVTLMNPKLKNHITALLQRVSESTRQIFSNRFFGGLTCVANALDNVAARRYVDQRCVENQIALFESGTLGPKGHVQVIIPFKTESYGSQNDPVEEGQIPHCTLKLFPEQTLHCIEWARDIFGRKFALQPKALAKFLQKGYSPDSGDIKALSESLKMVTKGPKNFDDCLFYAIVKFYKYFRDDVMQLLYTYPLDAKTKNGEPFWRLPKRPPTPILKFEPENPLHNTFVMSLAVLIAKIYQIPFPANFRSEKERLIAAKQAASVKIGQFVPSDQQAKAILKESADDKKEEKQKMGEESEEKVEENIQQLSSKNELQLYSQILQNAGKQFGIKAEEFQKDDDANGHIDFIYSASNLRALNYKLDPMDWITTKLKAGRIVPALVTTTSCVAGLQTLQLLKYLKKVQIDNMRNVYLNLAVPSLQMSQPGQLQKKKLKQGVQVTLWDKWELHCSEDVTFGQVYERLKKQYGLWPIGVLQGMSRVDFGKGEAEKKKFLSSKVLDKLEREEEYLDIVVLFTAAEEDDKILEGVPPVRLLFSNK